MDNGWIEVKNLGGVNFHNVEGENVYIHTRSGKTYEGMVICKSHSTHVFDDARIVNVINLMKLFYWMKMSVVLKMYII